MQAPSGFFYLFMRRPRRVSASDVPLTSAVRKISHGVEDGGAMPEEVWFSMFPDAVLVESDKMERTVGSSFVFCASFC